MCYDYYKEEDDDSKHEVYDPESSERIEDGKEDEDEDEDKEDEDDESDWTTPPFADIKK